MDKNNPMAGSMKYVAFLRGINVGGSKPIKMEELREAFVSLGFENPRTILASGNIVFESKRQGRPELVRKIQEGLRTRFGMDIPIVVRSLGEIESLFDTRPFEGVEITQQTRLYVTFLGEENAIEPGVPRTSPEDGFVILRASESEVFSVLRLSPGRSTTDLMDFLERHFGRGITTRNWNTIEKLIKV